MPAIKISQTDLQKKDAETVRISQYVSKAVASELSVIEAKLSNIPPPAAPPIHIDLGPINLQNRWFVRAVIETKLGGWVASLLERTLKFFYYTWLKFFKSNVHVPQLPDKTESAEFEEPSKDKAKYHQKPELSNTRYNPSIFTNRPHILIDVTPSASNPYVSGGIPRVVQALSAAGVETGLALPVCMKDDGLVSYYYHSKLDQNINVCADDVYLIADIFWYFMAEYQETILRLKLLDVTIALVLYDIFPLVYPTFYPSDMVECFEKNLLTILNHCKYVVCCSEYTKNSLLSYLQQREPEFRFGFEIRVCHLGVSRGANFSGIVRDEIVELFSDGPTLLSVGTLEPRKGYSVALDACDIAWRHGSTFKYIIFGRYGWRSRALEKRIIDHSEYGSRLFWIQDANDSELQYAYDKCYCLIQASIAEGFGLPILEATLQGVPTIASDIEVFREIAGPSLETFPVANPDELSQKILAALLLRPLPPRVEILEWTKVMRTMAGILEVNIE